MKKHLIEFDQQPWINAAKGLRYKVYKAGNQQIRLAEFSKGFIEEDWCLNGHAGYVLEGSCTIDFNGAEEYFRIGDVVMIPAGVQDKHKLSIQGEEKVLFLLFEIVRRYCILL